MTTTVPEVGVAIDGEPIGVTPLPATVPLRAGEHVVTASRPGYRTQSQRVTIEHGAEAELAFEMRRDPDPPPEHVGRVRIELPNAPYLIRVDGEPMIGLEIDLPIGAHRIELEVTDRQPYEGTLRIRPRAPSPSRPRWPGRWRRGAAASRPPTPSAPSASASPSRPGRSWSSGCRSSPGTRPRSRARTRKYCGSRPSTRGTWACPAAAVRWTRATTRGVRSSRIEPTRSRRSRTSRTSCARSPSAPPSRARCSGRSACRSGSPRLPEDGVDAAARATLRLGPGGLALDGRF
ncbi:MAG: PEGA domain-containing protein [Sandaracinaceae bacterium]|nr:PEGA domain-containing protein [Sandaracinaceae bacterium]